VSALVIAVAATVVVPLPSSAAVARVSGSGVVNGNAHFARAYNTGRFALDVRGRSGSIRYVNRAQRVRFWSLRIGLFRDESFDRFKIVALAGTGRLNGRVVPFYVRCIDDGARRTTSSTSISATAEVSGFLKPAAELRRATSPSPERSACAVSAPAPGAN
jgi:hypothetical protein